ncbi:MAG TPA: methyl-accepting chemotaxis protein [Gemmatimonadaceae bacterium]|jgi:methyl-accepting chemotaxis protein|nr:methyl-accepting chemotaxis protein [Gemmatimonadaceae bacterium]
MNLLRFDSIRSRLILGFSLIVGLLAIAGGVGRVAIANFSGEILGTLTTVRRETALTSSLTTSVAQELAAAGRYLDRAGEADLAAYRAHGWQAHQAQHALNGSDGLTSTEIGLIASIDESLSALEVGLTQAHRLRDLGRLAEAAARADSVRSLEAELTRDIERLSVMRAREVDRATDDLSTLADQRRQLLLTVVLIAIVLAVIIVLSTVRSIQRPLDRLVGHAQALSGGRLDHRTDGELPGEFRQLAEAMNTTAHSLSRMTGVATTTSEEVATSAHQLTSAAEQISLAASQTATAMSEVTEGAEIQVSSLRDADAALQTVRERAHEVRAGAEEVSDLSAEIERQAREKRAEITRALSLLVEIRQSVDRAAAEVRELNATAESINGFVGIVSRIAEQTNLLSLNAAIEAARAGSAGRGFAVVADEVRKLADQAQRAADDVVQLTAIVTRRVGTTTTAMETGATRVAEIESVSQGIDGALESIGKSAELTRAAAIGLGSAADANVGAVNEAAAGISQAARTAEGHAAAAEQVSASTQEQSAACEEMSSAATALLQGSVRLKEIVAGLREG